MSESINQQHIADQLEISRTTVSRCFTNHPGINPETRAKVFDLAAKLGYYYSAARTGAAVNKSASHTIGVMVFNDFSERHLREYDSPWMQILPGISEYLQIEKAQLDLQLIDHASQHLLQQPFRSIRGIRKKIWKGAIFVYPFPISILEEVSQRLPSVSLVEQFGISLNCLDVDHSKGISDIIERLLSLGHRRIGFFSRHYPVAACWAYRRFSAYVERLTREGLHVRWEDVINMNPNEDKTLEEGFQHLLRQTQEGVTAWVCAADHLGYDVIEFLKNHGFSVPQQVSVTGFDGIRPPKDAIPLTTLRIPYKEIGFTGAKRVFDLIRKRFDSVQHTLLECVLTEGESTGPVYKPSQNGKTT